MCVRSKHFRVVIAGLRTSFEKSIFSTSFEKSFNVLDNVLLLGLIVYFIIGISNNRGVSKTKSSAWDKALCENSWRLSAVKQFHKTLHLKCLTEFWICLWPHFTIFTMLYLFSLFQENQIKHQVISDMHYTLKSGFGFYQPQLEREFVELLERQLDIEFKGKCTSIVKFNPGKPCYISKSIKELKLELRKLLKRSIILSFVFALYVLLGAFVFFWIENCLDVNKSKDQANYLSSFGDDVQNINKTCREILKVIGNYSNTSIVETDFTTYDNYCQSLLHSSNTVQNFTRSCSVKSKIILEYTYFTLLSVLTIGKLPLTLFSEAALQGVLKKTFSENMQQIYRRATIPKSDFNKVAWQLQ